MAYRSIDLRIWGDEKFRRLSVPPPNARDLFFYLLTARESILIPGVIPAGAASIAETLGWTPEEVRRTFIELEAQGMAKADWDARLVWVCNSLKYSPPDSATHVVGWAKSWGLVPECPLKSEIYQSFASHMEARGGDFPATFQKYFGTHRTWIAGGRSIPHQGDHQIPTGGVPQGVPPVVPPTPRSGSVTGSVTGSGSAGEKPPAAASKVVDDLFLDDVPPAPKPTRKKRTPDRKDSDQIRLGKWMLKRRSEHLGDDVLPDRPWTDQEANTKLKPLTNVEDDLLDAAFDIFLDDPKMQAMDPPCPVRLFVHSWSEWVSKAMKKQGAA